jgi:hypothetical protein
MRLACLAVLAACGASAPSAVSSKTPSSGPPSIELVAIGRDDATFAATKADGSVAITRTVALPFMYFEGHIWWKGAVAAVGFDDDKQPHVGTITARGFEELPFPTAWPPALDPDLDGAMPRYSFRSTPNGELWLQRCLGQIHLAGKECLERAYARLLPTPSPPQLTTPPERPIYRLAKVMPAPDVRIEIAGDRKTLRCTQAGRTVTYPSEDVQDSAFELTNLVWVSQVPPEFRITHALSCNGICYTEITFEGCAPSARYEHAQLAAGPDGVYALYTQGDASVRWRGRELGRIEGSFTQLSFAPR